MTMLEQSQSEISRKLGGFTHLCLVELAALLLAFATPAGAALAPVKGPDLVLWLDASDIPGQPRRSGSITNWPDKSSYHNDARQVVLNPQPSCVRDASDDGVPTVRFQAASRQFLSVSHAPLRSF